jgi:adenosylcobyric acid synthase
VLPGSKDTLGDLAWLKAQGLDGWVRAQHAAGATVVGICGGYQMLGETIADPLAVEAGGGSAAGLGLLPAATILADTKITRAIRATSPGGVLFPAYEIHMGVTTLRAPLPPFARLADGSGEGARGDRVLGTYLHGALEDPGVCAELLGVPVTAPRSKADEHAALARWFAEHVEHPEAWLP